MSSTTTMNKRCAVFAGFLVCVQILQVSGKSLDEREWPYAYRNPEKIPIPDDTPERTVQDKPSHDSRRTNGGRRKAVHKNVQNITPIIDSYIDYTAAHEGFLSDSGIVTNIVLPKDQPRPKKQNALDDFFSASNTVMIYDEDTRKYFLQSDNTNKVSNGKGKSKGRKRHSRSKDGKGKRARRARKLAKNVKFQESEQALLYQGDVAAPTDNPTYSNRATHEGKRPIDEPLVIAMHSPIRVFVPILSTGTEDRTTSNNKGICLRCPSAFSLIAKKGEDRAALPLPAIHICSRLANSSGRLNLAVTSGPRPGTLLAQGEYPIVLIAWKGGSKVSSCQYTAKVQVLQCPELKTDGKLDCTKGRVWGSVCKFKCRSNEVLHGDHTISCDREHRGMKWSSSPPVCIKEEKSVRVTRKPCPSPKPPVNGTIACESNKHKRMRPHGEMCQYFCYPRYDMVTMPDSGSIIACKDGSWIPQITVTCRGKMHGPQMNNRKAS